MRQKKIATVSVENYDRRREALWIEQKLLCHFVCHHHFHFVGTRTVRAGNRNIQ